MTDVYREMRRAHPYFGAVFVDGNNYGFWDRKQYPYRKKPDEFVVGIFGGSTAHYLAQYLDSTQAWAMAKAKAGKKVVIVNFSVLGMKQPQVFYVATRFLEFVDAAIVLDGWNEAQAQVCPFPVEYPEGYSVLFSSQSNSESFLELFELERNWSKRSEWLHRSLLSFSPTVFLLWSNEKFKKINRSIELRKSIEAEASNRKANFEGCSLNDEAADVLKYKTWKKYYEYFQMLAQQLNVPTFEFLQPNPFLPGVKPLSEAEKEAINFDSGRFGIKFSPGSNAAAFRKQYLRDNLPGTHDLSEIFKTVQEPVYIDPYTHLNEKGYSILQQHIRKRLELRKIF